MNFIFILYFPNLKKQISCAPFSIILQDLIPVDLISSDALNKHARGLFVNLFQIYLQSIYRFIASLKIDVLDPTLVIN